MEKAHDKKIEAKPAARKRGRPKGVTAAHHPALTKPQTHSVAHPTHQTKPAIASKGTTKGIYAVGRRKTSVSQVLISEGSGNITVNKLPFEKYFQTQDLQHIVLSPMVSLGLEKGIDVRSKVSSGGIHSQAESLRHAIARALVKRDAESRTVVKKLGYLKRDPRIKERKKPGLKRARRAPQFSKR
jgi:small subunit ribosomal protein S9